ncbi:hypothetical protein [Microvirga sp. 2TAF3]|uniref:hypothetical protein n=1 Tax=Microvirga sp. 2TAF3 TaxID=3233014 RepID=UPI003F96A0AB
MLASTLAILMSMLSIAAGAVLATLTLGMFLLMSIFVWATGWDGVWFVLRALFVVTIIALVAREIFMSILGLGWTWLLRSEGGTLEVGSSRILGLDGFAG